MAVRTSGHGTNEVSNQPPPLEDLDLFQTNRPLVEAFEREGAGWARELAGDVGRTWGSAHVLRLGADANEHPPQLRAFNRFGQRIDEVAFHPAWHELMATASAQRLHALPWTSERPAHVARAALFATASQAEAGVGCPISMTYAAVPALRQAPEVSEAWEPLLTAAAYDPELRPRAEKTSAKCGMAMTEKQGGSDVRTNTTTARPAGDGGYVLTGHKWFCSAPMCDLFLVLAQADEGLTCFAMPSCSSSRHSHRRHGWHCSWRPGSLTHRRRRTASRAACACRSGRCRAIWRGLRAPHRLR